MVKFVVKFDILIVTNHQPIIIAGTAIPATKAIMTGAPTRVPSCQSSFFFLDHGLVPLIYEMNLINY